MRALGLFCVFVARVRKKFEGARMRALGLFCVLFFASACFQDTPPSPAPNQITVICNCGSSVLVKGQGKSRRAAENTAQEKCNLLDGPAVTKCKTGKTSCFQRRRN